MAIQVRRGNEADFDASKMLPGEWAVSLDTKYVRMCFAPGIVLRMATYEGFEADKAQFQAILAECRSIQEVVRRIGNEVSEKASLTIEYSNSAKESAERAKIYADNAEAVTGVQIATKDRAGLVKGGDNHIAEDGTLMLITSTISPTMPNSYDGRLKIDEIVGGESQQGENPSPTNPQEIKKTVVSEIKTHGVNFLDISAMVETTAEGVTFTPQPDGGIRVKGTATAQANYYLVGNRTAPQTIDGIEENSNIYIKFKTAVGICYVRYVSGDVSANIGKDSVVEYASDCKIILRVGTGAVVDETIYVMVSKDADATYEPYTESVITLSQPIELYGIGDVKDVIEGGKVKRKYGVEVFDGSNDEGWAFDSSINRIYSTILKNKTKRPISDEESINMLCSALLVKSFNAVYRGTDGVNVNASGTVSAKYSGLTSLSEWKAYLTEHPMTVVYEMAEGVIEELPIADQIALNSLSTYGGITYLEFDSEIEPTFKGEYGTSKVGGYTLEGMLAGRNGELYGKSYADRINALEASVVNNI